MRSSDAEIDATLDRNELEHIHEVAKRVLREGQDLVSKREWQTIQSEFSLEDPEQALDRLIKKKPDET